MFGFEESRLTLETTTLLCDYKHVVYEGFLKSLELGVPREPAAILVDEQFGKKIHEEARVAGITRILTTEKSGQDEFDFEYGDQFGNHVNALKPDYVKVLVRYNPANDQTLNQRQIKRLKTMNDFCHANGYKFLFELLTPATPEQLAASNGNQETYDATTRSHLMQDGIKELQAGGIEPDIWKIEGLNDLGQMTAVINQTRSGNRDAVGVIVLGRGEREEKVKGWLMVAAKIPGVVGFAVGRTIFKQPLVDLHQKKMTREATVKKIADNFKGFVNLFEYAQG